MPSLRWFKKLGAFTLGQVGIQVVSAGTGFLLIHALSKQHYAWFTIANTMAASISVLSDSGVSVALTSQAGSIWSDRPRFASLIGAGLKMRRTLILMSIIVTLPWTLWLLIHNHCPWATSVFLVITVIAGIGPSTSTAVVNVASRMHGRVTNLLVVDAVLAVARLTMIGACQLFQGLNIITATLATTIAQISQYVEARRRNLQVADWRTGDPATYRTEVRTTVRHFIPNSIFVTVQGNLTTWLIGIFAVSESVADLGALSRMSFVFMFFGLPITQILGPAFSRCQDPRLLTVRAMQIVSALLVASVAVVLSAWIYPQAFLFLLGPKYAGLQTELLWITCLLSLNSMNQLIWELVMSKGWIQKTWLQIPLTLLAQVVFLKYFPIATVIGTIQFGMVSAVPPLIIAFAALVHGLVRERMIGLGKAAAS